MQIPMRYGRHGLDLHLPDDWDVTVIRKPAMPVIPDPAAAVADALRRPVGLESLAAAARDCQTACILVCDITRPVPNGTILRPLIEHLMHAGIARDKIGVLVATGLHRPNQDEELREVIGDDWVLDHVAVANHFARTDADHVDLGRTAMGTPVKLDRRLVAADLRIAVGLVEPHFMAGYSGGRKLIMPGVAHHETITCLHNARVMGHPRAVNCVLEGNPLHDQQLEIVRLLGGALAVNTVIDEDRRLAFVNFGEIVASHRQAVDFVRPYAEVPVSRPFATVVTSSAGYPLDATYYQTVKAMVAAMGILAPGGDMFVVSEIAEGLGSPDYRAAQERLVRLGAEGFWDAIQHDAQAAIDAWQTQEQVKAMRAGKIHLYSRGLSAEDARLTGVHVVDDLAAALGSSAGDHKRVAVIPEGPYVVPRVAACQPPP
jgi:nickel-dependent lactate racemase